MHLPPVGPTCPHCGSLAPYGDSRLVWLNAHIDNIPHRLWWKLKKRLKKVGNGSDDHGM